MHRACTELASACPRREVGGRQPSANAKPRERAPEAPTAALPRSFQRLRQSGDRGVRAQRRGPQRAARFTAKFLLSAIGSVEAKKEGKTLRDVEPQGDKYAHGFEETAAANGLPAWRELLPFHYMSTGAETLFASRIDPTIKPREVFSFHRPETLLRWVQTEPTMRTRLRTMPPRHGRTARRPGHRGERPGGVLPRRPAAVAVTPTPRPSCPTRNHDLDAFAVARWSVQRVWWRCGSRGHEWRVTPQNRASCPRCSARRPVARERSLAILRPDLAPELHPTRNRDLDPHQIGASADRSGGGSAATAGESGRRASPAAFTAPAAARPARNGKPR